MVDVATISGAIGSLQTAAQIAKSMIGLRDAAMIQGKVVELQGAILEAQSSALTAQSEQFSLIERVRALEQQIAHLEAWETEKQRYELTQLAPGALAYVVKPAAQAAEPIHAICANCYEHGRKSVLQWSDRMYGDITFACVACKSEFQGHPGDDFILKTGKRASGATSAAAYRGADGCPRCLVRMRLDRETDDPVFGVMGMKLHHLICDTCGSKVDRQFQPGQGYV